MRMVLGVEVFASELCVTICQKGVACTAGCLKDAGVDVRSALSNWVVTDHRWP